jgi:protein-S-isoprenylcysteine O-methyltransferase Ste14
MRLATFVLLVVAWAWGECTLAAPDRPSRGTLALPTGIVLGASHVAGVLEHIAVGGGSLAGAAMLAGGIALRWWAISTLGPLFATSLEPMRRIHAGPYRWLRHPSELGLLLAAAGGALLLGSRVAVALGIALVPMSVLRCRRENQQLARLA